MSVVASAAGGLPDLGGHPRLTLVAPENPSALAAQIGLAMTCRYSDASCTQTATTSIAWRT
jgi:hypothetical protein